MIRCDFSLVLGGRRHKDEMIEQIKILLRKHQKIQAVKLYKDATGKGLKDSKEFVDGLERTRGVKI